MFDKCIIDLGCNDFADTIMYLNQGYYVYAIDANPYFIERAKDIIPHNFNAYYTALNYGISDNNSTNTFFVNKFSTWSSFNQHKGSKICSWNQELGGLKEQIIIQCITLEKLYQDHIKEKFKSIEYLKIDIEGKDLEALLSLLNIQNKPKFLSFELGGLNMLNIAAKLGYNKFQVVNQKQYNDIIRTITTVNGNKIDYRFILGCSGPFGIDLTSDWYEFSKAAQVIETLDRGNNNWYDLHCALS